MPRYREDEFDEEDEDDRSRAYRRGERSGRPRKGRGHSTIGIVSFLAALLAGVTIFGFVFGGVVAANRNGGEIGEDSPEAMLVGLGALAGMGVALLGLILGVIGLTLEGKKLFPILGTTMSGLILLGTVALICAGALMG